MKKDEILLFKDNKIKEDRIVGIAKVYDYSKLINAEGNRSVTPAIKQIQDSIRKNGVVSSIAAVLHKGSYFIVDGWHRKYVLEKEELPISITLVDATLEEINQILIVLNTTQKKWTPVDYLNNWVQVLGGADYIYLQGVHEHYDNVSLNALINIYNYNSSTKANNDTFRDGTWHISTKELGDRVLIYATELEEKTNMSFALKARFLHGFVECVSKKGYDQDRMIKQCKKYPKSIYYLDNPKDHARQINTLFNKGKIEEELVVLAV